MEHLLCRRLPRWLVSGALVFSLACGKPEDEKEPVTPPDDVPVTFEKASDRLLSMTSPPGWVVSRWSDGRIEHTGDSLLWTGMALGVLDCERGNVVEGALLTMLRETGGKAYRHPSEAARAPSLDGHLGLYWGISQRVSRCPDSMPVWASAVASHEPTSVPKPFDKVLGALRYQLGLAAAPTDAAALTDAVSVWAYGVVLTQAAGYRIHLGLLSLETLESTGVGLPAAARSKFCAASEAAQMPTVDWFCGRGDLVQWITAYEPNRYEMAHQRATWESPDGKEGLETPGLDLLVALRKVYEF